MNARLKRQLLKERTETVTETKRKYDEPRKGWARITIYLELETIKRLKEASEDYEIPMLEIANNAIKEYINRHCRD